MDNDQKDDSSLEDDLAALFRQQWRVIEGGKPMKVQRDHLDWSVRVDLRRRTFLRLL